VTATLIGSNTGFGGFGGSSSSSDGLAAQYRKNIMQFSIRPSTKNIDNSNSCCRDSDGDPSHVTGLSIDKGTSIKNGVSTKKIVQRAVLTEF
jgi:hypothetical protein